MPRSHPGKIGTRGDSRSAEASSGPVRSAPPHADRMDFEPGPPKVGMPESNRRQAPWSSGGFAPPRRVPRGFPGASSGAECAPAGSRQILFQCAECDRVIPEGSPLFRAHDRTYCSPSCRARRTPFAVQRNRRAGRAPSLVLSPSHGSYTHLDDPEGAPSLVTPPGHSNRATAALRWLGAALQGALDAVVNSMRVDDDFAWPHHFSV